MQERNFPTAIALDEVIKSLGAQLDDSVKDLMIALNDAAEKSEELKPFLAAGLEGGETPFGLFFAGMNVGWLLRERQMR